MTHYYCVFFYAHHHLSNIHWIFSLASCHCHHHSLVYHHHSLVCHHHSMVASGDFQVVTLS
jgi:hypothetical protein